MRPYLGFLLVAATATSASAQLPGQSVYEGRKNPREEVRARAYEEIKPVLADWSDQIAGRSQKRLDKILMDAVLFSPLGLLAEGRPAVGDSLAGWLPRISGYHLTPLDFDASGNLAYVFGAVRYDRKDAEAVAKTIEAEWVMVLYLWGRSWKVRSYFERPGVGGL